MRELLADCRHAVRLYVRTPGAILIAIGVLAIGMAFVGAFVSLYVDLILRPHPGFEASSRIVTYGVGETGLLPAEWLARIDDESTTLEAAAGVVHEAFLVGPDSERVVGELVSSRFFDGARPKLELGRGFEPGEHQADGEPVVVISYGFWQRQFDGRRDVLGQTIEVGGRGAAQTDPTNADGPTAFRIVGVMGRQYRGIFPNSAEGPTQLWIPVEQGLPIISRAFSPQFREVYISGYRMYGIARLAPGANALAAADELNARFSEEFAAASGYDVDFGVVDDLVLNPEVRRATHRQLNLFLGASVLLALVAAANVSLFLLTRAPGRRRELGIRMSVGAPIRRLARQLASEAVLLVAVSAVLGLVVSIWLAGFLRGLEFLRRANWRDVSLLDWRVLAIVGAFLALLALLVSLAPILGLKRLGIAASSRQISARAGFAQRIAGTAQIAVAGTLGGAAVAFAWYLGSLIWGYPGYATRDLHVARYSIDTSQYYSGGNGDGFERFVVDQTRRREAIASLPGVTGVSLTSAVPGVRARIYSGYYSDPDDPSEMFSVPMAVIDGDYVDLLSLDLRYGRAPNPTEPSEMLVNQALAESMWGRENVVGELLGSGGPGSGRVVGVLADLSYGHPEADAAPMGFATAPQQFLSSLYALVRSTATSAELRGQLQGLVDSGALEVTIDDVAPLAARRLEVLAADRSRGLLTLVTAAIVVLLAGFGFYSTQRYLVAAGRREHAIRAALGAGPKALGRLVFRQGLLLSAPGLAFGAVLAFILVAWLRDEYVSPDISASVVTFAVVTGLIALLLAASVGPATEARRTQPAALLRED